MITRKFWVDYTQIKEWLLYLIFRLELCDDIRENLGEVGTCMRGSLSKTEECLAQNQRLIYIRDEVRVYTFLYEWHNNQLLSILNIT